MWIQSASAMLRSQADETVRKIAALQRLRPGWSYGRGAKIGGTIMAQAILWSFLLYRLGFRNVVPYPLEGGGILLVTSAENGTLEVTLYEDGLVSLLTENALGDVEETPYISQSVAQDRLQNIADLLCASSASRPSYTGVSRSTDSSLALSSLHQERVEARLPSSGVNARSIEAGAFVNTWQSTTRVIQTFRRYSSPSMRPSFPAAA